MIYTLLLNTTNMFIYFDIQKLVCYTFTFTTYLFSYNIFLHPVDVKCFYSSILYLLLAYSFSLLIYL